MRGTYVSCEGALCLDGALSPLFSPSYLLSLL